VKRVREDEREREHDCIKKTLRSHHRQIASTKKGAGHSERREEQKNLDLLQGMTRRGERRGYPRATQWKKGKPSITKKVKRVTPVHDGGSSGSGEKKHLLENRDERPPQASNSSKGRFEKEETKGTEISHLSRTVRGIMQK